MAKIRFFYGVMGSSKTLNLLATAYNFEEKGIPFMVLKPSIDTRDGKNMIKSRAGLKRACVSVNSNVDIYETIHQYNNVLMAQQAKPLMWVLVDECQFLTEEQVDQLSDVVDLMGVNVLCYGLRTDFRSKLFPASKRLFEIADEFQELKSSCKCNKKESINARFDKDENIITEGEQVLVGGDDIYQPMCRKCWKQKIREKQRVKKYETSN